MFPVNYSFPALRISEARDGKEDGQTDGRTDEVQRIMQPIGRATWG